MPEIITRKEARARGLKLYFNGPCIRGHLCGRRVDSKNCLECVKLRKHTPEFRKKHAARIAVWRKENPERAREISLKYWAKAENRKKKDMGNADRLRKQRLALRALRELGIEI